MNVFLCCIVKGLHFALMMFPEPVATSLREDGFAVWMWECVITLYVQHSERERERDWPRCFTVPCSGNNQGPWLKLCKSEITFCWVIILSDKLSDLNLQKYVAPFLLHPFHSSRLHQRIWLTQYFYTVLHDKLMIHDQCDQSVTDQRYWFLKVLGTKSGLE